MACDLKTLLASACGNNFLQLATTDPKLARAVALQLLCDISGSSGSVTFKTATASLSGNLVQAAHGLGSVPQSLRAVLQCLSNDASSGYVAGQEINIEAVQNSVSPFNNPSIYADATNVYAAFSAWTGVQMRIMNAAGGANATFSNVSANFQIKWYFL